MHSLKGKGFWAMCFLTVQWKSWGSSVVLIPMTTIVWAKTFETLQNKTESMVCKCAITCDSLKGHRNIKKNTLKEFSCDPVILEVNLEWIKSTWTWKIKFSDVPATFINYIYCTSKFPTNTICCWSDCFGHFKVFWEELYKELNSLVEVEPRFYYCTGIPD